MSNTGNIRQVVRARPSGARNFADAVRRAAREATEQPFSGDMNENRRALYLRRLRPVLFDPTPNSTPAFWPSFTARRGQPCRRERDASHGMVALKSCARNATAISDVFPMAPARPACATASIQR
jgi:peptide methionine sulfoxide reductase MsrB